MSDILPVVIEPDAPAKAAVIWMHGLGADGHDFEEIVPSLGFAVSSNNCNLNLRCKQINLPPQK
jgi:predicted esterase